MKTITKEYNVLEISDIEKAVSDFLGEPTKISEIDCELKYWIDDDDKPTEMYLDFGECTAEDLFYDNELKGYYIDGKRLSLSDPTHPLDEIFAFDVSEFRSFNAWTDLESKYGF
jgi:hypothetical protein